MKQKTVYDSPNEWVESLKNRDEGHWFLDHSNQEKILFELAKEIYFDDEREYCFQDALEEADAVLTEFYNYRYNPTTRKAR